MDSSAFAVQAGNTSCNCMDADAKSRDTKGVFRCLPQAPSRRAKKEKPRAQTVTGKAGRGDSVLIKDRNTPSMQRSAHDSRLYLYLGLLFCDICGASDSISFCGHFCRRCLGNSGASNSTNSPTHMRVLAWTTWTAI